MKAHRRVVLFGAGASYGARPEPRPPLGTQLHRYVQDYLKAAWSELNDLEDCDGTTTSRVRKELDCRLRGAISFEALVNDLLTQQNFSLLHKLNALMAYALTPPINDDPRVDNSFVEQPDMYDSFLSKNFPASKSLQSSSFITLNYDCLFERAICRSYQQEADPIAQQCLCEHVNYRLQYNSSGIELLKPHGSINWVPDVTLVDRTLQGDSPIPIVGTIHQNHTMEWTKVDPLPSPKEGHTEEIVVAHYALQKIPQANPHLLQKIRDLAIDRTRDAALIEIIGVHLPPDPPDDPFLWKLLELMACKAKADCQVVYVNPDPKEIERARGYYHFETIEKTFQDYVASALGCYRPAPAV